ncbi:MAG: hypothetical protein HOP19_20170 [Acidobacteria bacterium]|nr:hypothetical protein [Acidobacteriota bacterium]
MNEAINYPNQIEMTDQPPLTEDLTVSPQQAEAVKGGPVEIKELHIKVTVDPPKSNP